MRDVDAIPQFREVIRSAGLIPPDMIEPDKLHRFSTNGKRTDDAGWCRMFPDLAGGVYGDHRTGLYGVWQAKRGKPFTPAEHDAFRQRCDQERKEREAAKARERADAARKAAAIWKAATTARADHPYLSSKRVSPVVTLREIDASAAAAILGYAPKSDGDPLAGRLLVAPVKVGDALSTLELIDEAGDKSALYRGAKAGGYWAAQPLPDGDGAGLTLLIGEGVATALSAKEASGHPSIAALSAGNLPAVAKIMRERYQAAVLVILADLVKATGAPDPHAIEAARSVGGLVAVPQFADGELIDGETPTDFNDMAALHGLEAVKQAIASAAAPARPAHQPDTDNALAGDPDAWPEPQPLAVKVEPQPYPLDALPDTIRAAVEEVAAFVKAPLPMVASSALAALSLAIQAHADVKRADKLTGPASLFLLTIADSGERKSTCDGFFTKAIRDYEQAQAEAAKPILKDHNAAIEAWEAKRGGIKDKIRQLAKESKPTVGMESALRDLEHDKPEPPKIPRLLYADATPEALAFGLAKHWPSGGVVSAEAGIVFGSHGMGKDSVMRNLAMLNQLWDGNSLTIDRRTSESFTVLGARLTVALQVQDATLREFFERSGTLARGCGFLARFLVAWPESTQGFRPFTEAPANWPHLAQFNQRITAILDQPAPIDDDGVLTPAMLDITAEAKASWVEFYNAIEGELASGGELYDVRDVASKTADNTARLAALFHIFIGKSSSFIFSNITVEQIESASRIAAWHLNESRRFFGELALPVELANAARLDTWLVDYCRRERTHLVPIAKLQQGGPGGLRSKAIIQSAMVELGEAGRARWAQSGKRKMIAVNPALLIDGGAS